MVEVVAVVALVVVGVVVVGVVVVGGVGVVDVMVEKALKGGSCLFPIRSSSLSGCTGWQWHV